MCALYDSEGLRIRTVKNVYMTLWQSVISRFCEHYCIYYCMLRSRGIDMPKIVSSFTADTALNDVLVHGFVCHVLNE